MATSRRVRRKLHRAAISDVLCEISTSYVWRARIFEAGLGTELVVDASTADNMPQTVIAALRRGGLRYLAAWVPHAWTRGYAGYDEYIMFRLQAAEFPDIFQFSANNPATIYGQPQRWPAR